MITLTASAVKQIKEIIASDPEATGKFLRIGLEPGGCSGYTYVFALDEKHDEDDVVEQDGLTVVIDPISFKFLEGAKIDYVVGFTGAGFKIDNPNKKNSCGCGQSDSF